MSRTSPHAFWGRLIAVAAALVMTVAGGVLSAAGSTGSPRPIPPKSDSLNIDALVFIYSDPVNGDNVSIAYTTSVSRTQAKSDLAELQRVSGWKLTDVKSDTQPQMPGAEPTTSLGFRAFGPIDYQNGYLRLEPFVTALRRLKRMEVQFLIPSQFDFRGMQDFRNDTVNVKFGKNGVSYNYYVELAKSDFANLGLPGPRTGRGLGWLVILVIAVFAGAIAYLASARYMRLKKSQDGGSR